MDLASAVQFLLAYEASLKLAPGQKPPPPSPSLFFQLLDAAKIIQVELESKAPVLHFDEVPLSVWSDWPLCCGLDLTPAELNTARSLPAPLLQERGLLSLFLALHSCAEAGIDPLLAPHAQILLACRRNSSTSEEDDPAPFPSAHLAARVGHRLINADDTLEFAVEVYGEKALTMWEGCIFIPTNVLSGTNSRPSMPAVPHEAARLSLAKEMAAMLDAMCAAQRPLEGDKPKRGRGLTNRLPFIMGCHLLTWLDAVLNRAETTTIAQTLIRTDVYKEAAALPAYDPVLLLQGFFSNKVHGLWSRELSPETLETCRLLLWKPLSHRGLLSKLRPTDASTALRLGLEDLVRPGAGGDEWSSLFTGFAIDALHLGLVRPELVLRARPQLLEGLVECLVRKRIRGMRAPMRGVSVVSLMARSPAVSFHLRKFFSRSGFLQEIRDTLTPLDCRIGLIRLLGPRAAQLDTKKWEGMPELLGLIEEARINIRATAEAMDPSMPVMIVDSLIRYLTLDRLREPRHAQPILEYLSELTEEIAASKRPNAQYGALMVVEIGKACLAFSSTVARGLDDIREAGPKGKSLRGSGGARASTGGIGQKGWRARLVAMERQLSLLRRRLLHELLPLAEAREAALWEGVREEEVVAALRGGA